MKRRDILRLVLGITLLCAANTGWAKISPEQVQDLFVQANEAFSAANAETDLTQSDRLYDKAILSFERVINEGQINNAKLFYNLANAYLLRKDLGRAILNYRRALQLDSADANIKKNLAFARSRRQDKITLQTEQKVLQTLFFWHYDFSLRIRFLLACLGFAGVCVGLTVMVWRGRSSLILTFTIISGVLVACFISSVGLDMRKQKQQAYGVVIASEVVARQGDGLNYPASFKEPLHAGTEFRLLEKRPGWFYIQLADESEAWIQDDKGQEI
jgi:tetratricopeptide (TPR) repeat protein